MLNIWKLLNPQPAASSTLNFLELSRALGQEWQDIADLEGQASSETAAIGADALERRYRV